MNIVLIKRYMHTEPLTKRKYVSVIWSLTGQENRFARLYTVSNRIYMKSQQKEAASINMQLGSLFSQTMAQNVHQ
jgi:hypothetical protein